MLELEKSVIVDFLKTSDPEMDYDLSGLEIGDLIDMLIDRASEMELDYSILSTAFVNGVNPGRFDEFHEQVMNQYETIEDGQEIAEPVLDRIAAQYK